MQVKEVEYDETEPYFPIQLSMTRDDAEVLKRLVRNLVPTNNGLTTEPELNPAEIRMQVTVVYAISVAFREHDKRMEKMQ